MATLELPAISKEYIKVPVAVPTGVDPTDPALGVEMAFLAPGDEPEAPDWQTGSWAQEAGVWLARCLVGPGSGVGQLAAGEWVIWLRITSNPEIPARKVGTLLVF